MSSYKTHTHHLITMIGAPLSFFFLLSTAAYGEDNNHEANAEANAQAQTDIDCSTQKNIDNTLNIPVSTIAEIMQKADAAPPTPTPEPLPRWIDARFAYTTAKDLKNLDYTELQLGEATSKMGLSQAQANNVYELYTSIFNGNTQKTPAYPNATTLPQAYALLDQANATLSDQEKLLLMSYLGNQLLTHYSPSGTEDRDLNAVYLNSLLRNATASNGGVCGDIHHLLRDFSAHIGMLDGATATGIWNEKSNPGESTGGHILLLYRDPNTNQYVIQNYQHLLQTGATTEQAALDVAGKTMTALENVSYTDSTNGRIHTYIPATTQFVDTKVKDAAYNESAAPINISASNQELSVGAQYTQDLGNHNFARVFANTDQFKSGDGDYRTSAAGAAIQLVDEEKYKESAIEEEAQSLRFTTGVLDVQAPGYDYTHGQPKQLTSTTLFGQMEYDGHVKVSGITGTLDFEGKDYALGLTNSDLKVATLKADLSTDWAKDHITTDAGRTMNVLPSSISQSPGPVMRTAYDQVGIVFNSDPEHKNKAYLTIGQRFYVLDGVENMSSIAIESMVKAALPTRIGTFSLDAEYARSLANPSHDPFYDYKAANSIQMGWDKSMFHDHVDVAANVTRTEGTRILPFDTIGPVTPTMAADQKDTYGMLWVNLRY